MGEREGLALSMGRPCTTTAWRTTSAPARAARPCSAELSAVGGWGVVGSISMLEVREEELQGDSDVAPMSCRT